mmetsp:Transcript_13418/g.16690  ORF Transcript_13418/g.16690 Transcript_13418/m.16690 type:complete len:118 (+) Transcript_13418:291-644(+)|eukprot:CAMPEP_0204840838 /NCGR_PEP_ID=MMETSP1346-20131115/39231_1 /ASSEMBLY_ACC=CAM_ASM_000771 /TAXON_ID=215587 /ORGANISM="Aplanochytrium stocchinoi, Strain GSBS06" /LENGTH=117 /DNA_ID=CAMNT_0051978493 /DNA_START=226 /DNA_END=579 /DNA_ORIENTATION=-
MGHKNKKIITLENFEGSIVPILAGFSPDDFEELREKGVEIADFSKGRKLVYLKEYSKEEQVANLGGEKELAEKFHSGFSLVSFFAEFKDLRLLVDRSSVNNVAAFLLPEELALFEAD